MTLNTRVLVVDDDRDARRYVQRVLESAEYTVLQATDGQAALDIMAQEPVDLIVADIAMPRLNGYQLFERVMENPDWVAVPFIFLSARALDSDIRYAKLMGVDEYITKPVRAQDLLTAVQGRIQRAKLLNRSASQVRKVSDSSGEKGKMVFGYLSIDTGNYQVYLRDELVVLSVREFRLVKCLIEHDGDVVGLSDLAEVTHELKTESRQAGNLIRPLVRSVRRKFGYGPGEWGCIWSVRGVGYKIVKPEL